MNTITIKSWEDFVNKQRMILLHGKDHNVGMQFYKELCPCVVEVSTNCIHDIARNFFNIKNKNENIDFNDFVRIMKDVIYKGEDFTEIPGSEYIGSDYEKVKKCFNFYSYERQSGLLIRRQFSYSFNEKLCMNGMQIFEDEKLMILNFRSCDYVKKLSFDLYFINTLIEDFGLGIDKIYCIFGSLHIYKGEKIQKRYVHLFQGVI